MPHDFIDRADISESELEELKKSACGILKWEDKSPQWDYQWISVKDRLPDESEIILAVNNTLPYDQCIAQYGFFTGGKFYYDYSINNEDIEIENITHWMPLPEPPK